MRGNCRSGRNRKARQLASEMLRCLGCIMVSLQLSCASSRLAEKQRGSLDLLVTCSRGSAHEYIVRMRLKNVGPEPVSIAGNELPWVTWSRSTIFLACTPAPHPTVLDRVLVVSDAMPIARTLLPGGTITGEFVLNHRFEHFDTLLEERGLVVFWSTQLSAMPRHELQLFSGSFLLSYGSEPTGSCYRSF